MVRANHPTPELRTQRLAQIKARRPDRATRPYLDKGRPTVTFAGDGWGWTVPFDSMEQAEEARGEVMGP